MKIQLTNLSWTICLMLLVLVIAFPAEGVIERLDSQDESDTADNDEIYYSGQLIRIIATDSENRVGLKGTVTITSQSAGYSSGLRDLIDENDGSYTFLWDTTNLSEASDYIAYVVLGIGLEPGLRSLAITIENRPDPRIVINNGERFTANASAHLNLSEPDAVEMYISGDVVDDASSFEWIDYAESILVNLTAEHERKTVQVQFRYEDGSLSKIATATIDYEPALIDSQDANDPTDDDEIYHSGQSILLTVTEAQGRTGLDGKIQIKSPFVGYNSGMQKLSDGGNGSYTYLWHTSGLQDAADYTVSATITSVTGTVITAQPLNIAIDNDPPTDVSISINNGEPTTSLLSVTLTLTAQEAVEMFIEGDVVDDTNTFEWIPYPPLPLKGGDAAQLVANLTAGDGDKEVSVKFRDEALNESLPVKSIISLDRQSPRDFSVSIEEDAEYAASQTVTLTIDAQNASEMYIEGDVLPDANTYGWIKYASGKSVTLTEGDGEKRVKVKFRNAEKIESDFAEDTIILDSTPPNIQQVQSRDVDNPQDDDDYYRAGQQIEILVEAKPQAGTPARAETGLEGTIQIKSEVASYDSGIQTLTDEGNGFYSYIWKTDRLLNAVDYLVEVKLKDVLGREVLNNSLTISIDNEPPPQGIVVINDGQDSTDSRSVRLTISVGLTVDPATTEIYIEGDVVEDSNTFQWIDFTPTLVVNLTDEDGKKEVMVKFRDAALNESEPQTASITLDRASPKAGNLVIEGGESHIDYRLVTLTISAKNAVEMYLEGDIVDDAHTFQWITFASEKKVILSQGDGEKSIRVKFRNFKHIESESVEASIILDLESPVISLFESQDSTNPEDNDNYYHAGQSIILRITTEGNESGLSSNIRIKSVKSQYDSGLQKLTDKGDGSYSYTWDTTALKESLDYTVEAKLMDALEREVTDSITLIIDNTPPSGKITLNDNAPRTISRSITLNADARDAVEMHLSGDIVDDTNTFEWIPSEFGIPDSEFGIVLNLTDGAGEKVVRAKFKDRAGNESEEIEATIIFITKPPQIERVDSWDDSDTSDNDEYYRAGQIIKIVVWGYVEEAGEDVGEDEAWFLATIRINSSDKSSAAGYDSGSQDMFNEGDGRYTYLWDTTDLADGEYSVETVLSDGISIPPFDKGGTGGISTDNSLSITIDNTPPNVPSVEIDKSKTKTVERVDQLVVASTSVSLILQDVAGDPKEIYIEDDVIDDTNTFEWIPFVETLTINLTAGDGEKQISIKIRDAAKNESDVAIKTIVLDTTGPGGKILISEDVEYTVNPLVSIEIESVDATEMYLSGDIRIDDNTFEWIPYTSPIDIYLTKDDGEKAVKVAFKDDLGNMGEETEATITLDATPPKIESVNSHNIADLEDDDGRYYVGDTIKITPKLGSVGAQSPTESGLKGFLRITSETAGYDSGSQSLTVEDEDGEDDEGILSFLWETKHFQEADDYKVEIKLEDAAGNETTDSSLILALVSSSVQESVTINNGDEYTELEAVEIQLFSDSAAEMLIEGDVKDDSSTFEWIDYASALELKLTVGDGEKTITVTFRDKLLRESGPVEDTIILDTEAPNILAVKSHDADDEIDNDGRYHSGEVVKFIVETPEAETGLEGTIRIHSTKVSYDSGIQKLTEDGGGEYSYFWETTGLKEADDYIIEVALEDFTSHKTIDSALVITIDNTPPRNLEFGWRDGEEGEEENQSLPTVTKTRSITLTISAEDAVQMWLEGDLSDDTNTFEWIPFNPPPAPSQEGSKLELVVNLTPGDGEKVIQVRYRDEADNESEIAETTILLNELPPVIQSVDSADKDNPEDSDEIYRAGQQIVITIQSAEAETGLEAMVQIRSVGAQSPTPTEQSGYDSGLNRAIPTSESQNPNSEVEGSYSYLWDTSGLKSASDYTVKVTLQDSVGQKAVDESLTITIDNEPPTVGELTINNGEQFTNDRRVVAEITYTSDPDDDVVEMFIEGDIVEDDGTFKWFPIIETKEIQLTEGDGEKAVRVKFRDQALNETAPVEASITLDTTAPTNARIDINSGESETDSRSVTLNLLAEEATEMYLDGDVTESDNTFKWTLYKSLEQIELTEGDGVKQVGIKYRDDVGNESARVESSIILNQPGPTSPSIIINDEKTHTSSPIVTLSLSAEGATEMYIDGDIVVGNVTFKWIEYQSELQINLTKSDGDKQVRARFRNGPGNESEQVETSITLDQTAPVFEAVESYDADNPSDNDGIYHPDQIIVIKATESEGETGLEALVKIKSEEAKYDSGVQKLTDRGDGSYTYIWQTTDLQSAEDYIVEITLKDAVEHTIVDNSLIITMDSIAPTQLSVTLDVAEKTLLSRSVNLNIAAESAVEMFIEGDVIDDTNTFQWIPYPPPLLYPTPTSPGDAVRIVVNLAGNDGEKTIRVKFKDAAGNESEDEEINVNLELSSPRLLSDIHLIQPDRLETAYLVLPFDEAIGYISEEDFYINLSNPDRLEDRLDLEESEIETVIDDNKVIIRLTEELLDILRSWGVDDDSRGEPDQTQTGRIPDEIWVEIAENSIFDLVGNGNPGNKDKPSIARLTEPNFLQQAIVAPQEFSPNGDGIKDEAVILYALRNDSDVTVRVEDWRQNLISQWEQPSQPAGIPHELRWDGKKEDGSDCPDGIYTISIKNIDPLAEVFVVTKTLSVTIDNTPPQIIKAEPLAGNIPPTSEISMEVVDITINRASSGIDEGNVYVIFDNNPEQLFLLIKSLDEDNDTLTSSIKGESLDKGEKYTIPLSLIIPEGKHVITFHVADKAGNYAEEIVEYTIVATSESPILKLMNYPNPFKVGRNTTIRYVLVEEVESGVISIYDAGGNLVFLKHLEGVDLSPGEHQIKWDGIDLFGELLARGVYFCEFRVVDKDTTTKELHKIAVW